VLKPVYRQAQYPRFKSILPTLQKDSIIKSHLIRRFEYQRADEDKMRQLEKLMKKKMFDLHKSAS